MFAHKLLPLTLAPMCICPFDKTQSFHTNNCPALNVVWLYSLSPNEQVFVPGKLYLCFTIHGQGLDLPQRLAPLRRIFQGQAPDLARKY
jgi:hypothetical protein